ncbi:hypothetical protein ACHAXS_009555, partial [Conticribra weissflogii]
MLCEDYYHWKLGCYTHRQYSLIPSNLRQSGFYMLNKPGRPNNTVEMHKQCGNWQ